MNSLVVLFLGVLFSLSAWINFLICRKVNSLHELKNCAAKNTRCAGMLATVGSVALLFFSSMLALYLLADCFQLFPRAKAADMGFHAAFGGTIIGLVAEIIRYHRATTRN